MPARYEIIADLVRQRGWTRGAELGVFDGRTHEYLLRHCPRLHLIGVDVWSDCHEEGDTKSGERCHCPYCDETRVDRRARTTPERLARVLAVSREFDERSRVLRMTTSDAAGLTADSSLDFVFVDADHSTEGVYDDVTRWRSKVRVGGMLLGHDWNMASVRSAVTIARGDLDGVQTFDDHMWGFEL